MAEKLTELFVKIGADTTGLDKGLKKAEGSAQGFANKFGRQMKIAGVALIGLTAAVGGASLKLASDFDGAMREVNTMMQLSEDQFKSFSKEVQATAKELGVSATNSAKALYQAISAGIPKENVVDFLKVATQAAIGGVTDTTTAVDGLTTVLNAFKIPVDKAQHVADVMFTTVKGGKTTFEELSASMFNVAPIAASMKIKFETVSAALATMTKQGVPTAQATTQLRQAMVALSKPTSEMQAVIEELGYSSGQAMLEELGFAKSLNLLRDATQGSSEQLMKMFGSVEAGGAVLALTGQNAQTFQDDLDAMAGAAGAATEAFDQMEKTTARKFEKMKAQFSDIGITIGTALLPILQKLMDHLVPIIEKVSAWIEKHPKLTLALMAGALVMGGLLIILPKLIALIAILKGVTIIATVAQWAMNVAMSANPIGLIILAIAGLVAGIILLIKRFGIAKTIIALAILPITGMIGAITLLIANFDKVKAVFHVVAKFILDKFRAVVNFFKAIPAAIKTVFWKVVDFILAPIRFVVNKIIDSINWVIRMFNKLPGVNIGEVGGKIPMFSEPVALGGGAIVTKPTAAIIGDEGPEAVVPLRAGMAGTGGVTVIVQGSVWAAEDLAKEIRDQLLLIKDRNVTTGL